MHQYTHFNYDTEDHSHFVMTWREWLAVFGAALGAFMAILDIQITNASLREIQGSLGLDMTESGWISTAYLVAEIIVIPLTGFLSEVFGTRRYIVVNTALFAAASVLCGLSWNLNSIIAFRLIQGFVGGTLIPMSFQIILDFMPKDKKVVGMAIFGLTATLAPTLGPSVGGWLTDSYGWRSNFFINLLPAGIMIPMIYLGVPGEKLDWKRLKNMDIGGALTLSLGLGPLTYILEEGAKVQWFEDFTIQVATLVALCAFSIFIVIQCTRKEPLLNLNLLAERNFAISSVITLFAGAALYGGVFALSMYLGQLQNYSASQIGLVMMWVGLPQIVVMPLVPLLMKKIDARLLAAVGLALFAYSNYLNGHLDMNYGGEQFKISLIIRAVGQPLFLIPLSTLAMSLIEPQDTGSASSIFNMIRNIGGSIGIALAGSFVVSKQNEHFGQFMESLTLFRGPVSERLNMIEHVYRAQGLDAPSAHMMATKAVIGLAQRDSFVQSFSDIFMVLSLGLFLCIILTLFMRKVTGEGQLFE